MAAGATMVQRLRFAAGAFNNLRKREKPPDTALTFRLIWNNVRTQELERRFSIPAAYELVDPPALSLLTFNERFPDSPGFNAIRFEAFTVSFFLGSTNVDLHDAAQPTWE